MVFFGLSQSQPSSRFAFALGMFSALVLCFFLSPELEAARPPTKRSDAELSQALIGEWEISVSREDYPTKKKFISFDAKGAFKSFEIVDFVGHQARVDTEGKWRLDNGRLIQQLTKHHSLPMGWVTRDQIISFDNGVLILRTEEGDKNEMRRARIPVPLPRVLPLNAWDKLLVRKILPGYPYDARLERKTGTGVYNLYVNSKTGEVTSIKMVKSTGHRILDVAAMKALVDWRFKPNTVMKTRVPVTFIIGPGPGINYLRP